MDVSLDGKVALVTGAGPNIGSGIALALARYGAKVTCNDLEPGAAEAAGRRLSRHGGEGLALAGDVSAEADVVGNIRAVLDAWGRIDIVVNNAAWLHACGILEEDLASFNRAITIAVNGNFLYTKHAALAMIERDIRGSFVSILSSKAWQGAAGFIAYATHKGALANFVRAHPGRRAARPGRGAGLPGRRGRDDHRDRARCLSSDWRAWRSPPTWPARRWVTRAFSGSFAEASRLGLAVFVHAMPAASERLPGPATATSGVGVEGLLAAAAILTGGAAEKYPSLRLGFSHAAGGFPLMLTRAQWFWGRTWNEEPRGPAAHGPEAAPWAASETGPAELARRFWYDSLVFDRRAIRYLIDMLGAGRLLVGSDFPAMPREEPCGRTLRSMGLPGTDLDDITWYNCFRFLGIAPPKLFSMGEHDVG